MHNAFSQVSPLSHSFLLCLNDSCGLWHLPVIRKKGKDKSRTSISAAIGFIYNTTLIFQTSRLLELAPWNFFLVAGLRRASPSTALDKA